MNLKIAFFKVLITFYNMFRLTLVFVPLIYAILLIRTPQAVEIPILKVLFLSFAPALAVSVWNALRFEQYELLNPEYYQRSVQKVCIELQVTEQEIIQAIEPFLQKRKWKLLNQEENTWYLRTSPMRDQVVIRLDGNSLCIESKPYLPWLFIDYGRNYKNIIQLLVAIRRAKSST